MTTPQRTQAPIDVAPDISDKVESGWAAVAKSIREVDEQKIKDYKEDIDTILVFAGLYSAVLSALLVESVQNLQPNPSMITVLLLSQLVAQTQSYTIGSGFLNSTVAPLNVNTVINGFQPTLAAKRVNVLWFASLTLALISASFGILVKQWLREYLAGEYISPQARLRVRHFRTPGLEDWHVFTIAAMLPLLLQLALALFFVGLCFFTLDIHNSIGYTTIPLVGGWALLFVAASFAPALSPRCPYKIPLFKPIMRVLRSGLFQGMSLFSLPSLRDNTGGNITQHWTWRFLGDNEEDAAKDGKNDVDILVEVDRSQTDDQLVMKMCSALQEVHTKPEDVVDFVLKTIGFRLGTSYSRPVRMMLDLSGLSVRTSTILMQTVAETLRRDVARYPPSQNITWKPWMVDCFALLVAKLPCQLSDKAANVLTLCFAYTQYARLIATMETLVTLVSPDPDLCLHLIHRLRGALLNLDAVQLQGASFFVVRQCCCICDDRHRCRNLFTLDKVHSLPLLLRDSLCELFSDFLLRQLAAEVPWGYWHRDMLWVVLSRYAETRQSTSPWHDAFNGLGQRLATNRNVCPEWYRLLYDPAAYYEPAIGAFSDIYSSSSEKERILKTMHATFADYVTSQLAHSRAADLGAFILHVLKFLQGQRETMVATVSADDRVTVQRDYVPIWQQIWEVLRRALSSIDLQLTTQEQSASARTCLSVVDNIDNLWLPLRPFPGTDPDSDAHFERWAEMLPVQSSFFSDQVVEALMTLLPQSEQVLSNRVRRIRWLRQRSGYARPTFMYPPASSQPTAVTYPPATYQPVAALYPPPPQPRLSSPPSHTFPPLSSMPLPPPPPQFSFQYLHDLQEQAIAMQRDDDLRSVKSAARWPDSIHSQATSSQSNNIHGSAADTETRNNNTGPSQLNTAITDQENSKDSGHNGGERADANAKPDHPQSTSDPESRHDWQRDDAGFSHPGSALSVGEPRANGDNNLEDQSRYEAANGDGSRKHDQPDASTPAAGQ